MSLMRVWSLVFAGLVCSLCTAEEAPAKAVKLEFRLVHADSDALVKKLKDELWSSPRRANREVEREFLESKAPEGYELLSQTICVPPRIPKVIYCYVAKTVEMDGSSVSRAAAARNGSGQPMIRLSFDAEGRKKFADLTERNVGRQLAVVIGGKLCGTPRIYAPIFEGDIEITGSFTPEELDAVVNGLNSGAR